MTENELRMCCWNIRRGLIKREHEITELLRKEKLDVLFLVQTDSYAIMEEKDYKYIHTLTLTHSSLQALIQPKVKGDQMY